MELFKEPTFTELITAWLRALLWEAVQVVVDAVTLAMLNWALERKCESTS